MSLLGFHLWLQTSPSVRLAQTCQHSPSSNHCSSEACCSAIIIVYGFHDLLMPNSYALESACEMRSQFQANEVVKATATCLRAEMRILSRLLCYNDVVPNCRLFTLVQIQAQGKSPQRLAAR